MDNELMKEFSLCIDLLQELLDLAEQEVKPFVHTPQLVLDGVQDVVDRLATIEAHYE